MKKWISTTNREENIAQSPWDIHLGRHPGAKTTFELAETVLSLNGTDYDLTSRYLGRQATFTTWEESGLGTKNETLTWQGSGTGDTGRYLGFPIPGVDDESAAVGGSTPAANNGKWTTTAAGRPDLSAGGGFCVRFIAKFSFAQGHTNIFSTKLAYANDGLSISCSNAGNFLVEQATGTGDGALGMAGSSAELGRYGEYVVFYQPSGLSAVYVNGSRVHSETLTHSGGSINGVEFGLGSVITQNATSAGVSAPLALFDIWEGLDFTGVGLAEMDAAVAALGTVLPAQPSTFDGLPTEIRVGSNEYSLRTRFNGSDATTGSWADTGQGSSSATLTYTGVGTPTTGAAVTGVDDDTGAKASGTEYWEAATSSFLDLGGNIDFIIHAYIKPDLAASEYDSFGNSVSTGNGWKITQNSTTFAFQRYDGVTGDDYNQIAATAGSYQEVWFFVDSDGVCRGFKNTAAGATENLVANADVAPGNNFRIGGGLNGGSATEIAFMEIFLAPSGTGTLEEQQAVVDALSLRAT